MESFEPGSVESAKLSSVLDEGSKCGLNLNLTQIDLQGHCPFCLKLVETRLEGKSGRDSDNLRITSLNFLWPYLNYGEVGISLLGRTTTSPKLNFVAWSAGNESVSVPKVCESCNTEIKVLRGLHEELLRIRVRVKERVKRIHEIIKESGDCEVFLKDVLQDEGKSDACRKETKNFLEFVRMGIINSGGESLSQEGRVVSTGPQYPVTCELLFPTSPGRDHEEYSEEEEGGDESEDEKESIVIPDVEVKIEYFSGEEEEEQFEEHPVPTEVPRRGKRSMLKERERKEREDFQARKSGKAIVRSSRNESADSANEEESEQEDDDEGDPEFTIDDDEEEAMKTNSDSDNDSTIMGKDPLADLSSDSDSSSSSRTKKKKRKSESDPSFEVKPRRGRGRPRKYPPGTPRQRRRAKELRADSTENPTSSSGPIFTAILDKGPPGTNRFRYICDICKDPPAEFSSEVGLVRHKVDMHGAEPFICKTCKEPFYSPRSRFTHEKREHPEIPPDPMKYACDLCEKTFSSRFYVEHHKKVAHRKEKPYKCKYKNCDKSFTNHLGRNQHYKSVHMNQTFECSGCERIFKSEFHLERHQDNRHPYLPEVVERQRAKQERKNNDYRTVKIGRPPKNPNNLKRSHSISKEDDVGDQGSSVISNEGESNTCKKTPASNSDPPTASSSTAKPEEKKGSKFACEFCKNTYFSTSKQLASHKELKHPDKCEKYLCKTCNKSFLNQRARYHHETNYHPDIKPDPIRLPCDQCDKCFSALRALRIHQRVVHLNEKLYECEFEKCKKTFQNAAGLKAHTKAKHLNERYACDICGKDWPYASSLTRHKFAEHNICEGKKKWRKEKKKFPCTVCQPPEKAPTFLNEDSLKNHMIVSHGDDPHQCAQCGETFFWNQALICHIRRAHGTTREDKQESKETTKEKPVFTCEICGKQYLNKENLKLHLFKHDPDWKSKVQPYTCEICGKSYLLKTGYKSHMKMRHRSTTTRICHLCGMSFINMAYLKKHLLNHVTVRNHFCTHCPARFKRKDTRDKHIREVHNRVKQRNVGIRRMHFRHLDSESPSSTQAQGTGTSMTSSNSTSALAPGPATDFPGANISEVKRSGIEEVSTGCANLNNSTISNFPNSNAKALPNNYGFTNL